MGLQHFKSVLGYPTRGCRVEREFVAYPSAPSSNYQPPSIQNFARLSSFTGRRILRQPGIRFQCRQSVELADSWCWGMVKVLWKNSKILYPLWIFSQLKSTVSGQCCLDFCENCILTQIWLKNQNSRISKRFMCFIHLF